MIVRKDADGNPTSFQARYVNPLDPPKKVGRNFGLEYETEAYKWLDVEHYLAALGDAGAPAPDASEIDHLTDADGDADTATA